MLPPSPLIPMKALKATGILLGYILGIGLFFALLFGCVALVISSFSEKTINYIAFGTMIVVFLYIPWRAIYDSL